MKRTRMPAKAFHPEEALRQSEERFRTMFDNAPIGITIAVMGITRYSNPAALRVFGYSDLSEVVGTSQLNRIAPEFREFAAERIREHVNDLSRSGTYEILGLRKDGTAFPLYARVVGIEVDGSPGTITFVEDLTERRTAEKAIQESERRLADIIDILPDSTFVIDRDGKVIAWNRAMEEMTGIPAMEMIGKGDYEYASPFYGERRPILIDLALKSDLETEKKYARVKRKDEVIVGEAYMPALRGGEVYLLGTASVLRDSNGNVVGAVESIHDLTARRQAEVALRNALEFNRAIIDGAEDGIAVLDRDLRFRAWNRVMAARTGISAGDVLGKNALELFPALTRNGMDRLLMRALQGETSLYADLPFSTSFNYERWVQGHFGPYRDAEGNVTGVIGVFRDITERIKAEKALREKEQHYRLLFESANDGVFVIEDGVFIDCNAKTLEMFGCGRELLIGQGPEQYSPERQPDGRTSKEKAEECLANAMQHGSHLFAWTHCRPDGALLETEVSLTRFEYGGRFLIMAIVRDVTERRRVEKEKEQLQRQLLQAQKMEALGTLAGGIAHDFNNVLMAIAGFAELARIERIDESREECLDQVLTACERAKGLVNQILTFSRMQEIERHPVQINQMIKEGLKLLRSSIPTTIDICLKMDPRQAIVFADPTNIHQVLMNLCTNAAHAMRDRGGTLTVTLTLELFRKGVSPAPCGLPDGRYAKLQVADTGIGMSEETKERIFEPFFTTKPQGEGTGLGLSVVYGIVKSCGGGIDIECKPGKGTMVTIYLPAVDKREALGYSASAEIPAGSEHILFVDDEPMLVDLGARMLRSLGYRVTTRTSSLEALDYFRIRYRDVDLVVTDITMPHLTGAELARKMIEIRQDMPVILCTGYSEMINEEKARNIGARGYVMKPVNRADLAKAVREALDGGKG